MRPETIMIEIIASFIQNGMPPGDVTVRKYADWLALNWKSFTDNERDEMLRVGVSLYGLSIKEVAKAKALVKDTFPK